MKKTLTKAQVLLHPIRAQIVVALHDRPLTPRQIAAQIEPIPLGTVYRHINLLLDAGIIEVTRERRVYGTLERQFALKDAASYIDEKEREQLTAEDIVGLVTALTGVVQSTFARYVQSHQMPPAPGELAFVVRSLYLTPEEYAHFRAEFIQLISKTGRDSSPDYERRMIGLFSAPDIASALPLDND
jgi:DNA-binding transcriptional ArsR family regulator